MRSHRLSFSRLLPCLWWARPDVDCPDDPPGEKAQIGTCSHSLSEDRAGGKPFDRSQHTDTVYAEAKAIFDGPLSAWVDAWKAGPGRKIVEARLRYDAEEDRSFETPRRGEEGYSRPGPMQMTGEMDFITLFDDHAELVDLKTGQKRYTSESQLRGYSVVLSRKYNVSRVRSRFLYARKTKLIETDWIEMDADALDAEAGAIRRTLRTLPMAEPVKGDHCWRCPLGEKRFGYCPAWIVDERYMPDSITEARLYDEGTSLSF